MALHTGTGHSKGHLNRLSAGSGSVFPAVGSVADYDFRNSRYSGPALSVANASGGYVDDSQGNWTFVAPNTLRRSDKGALIEGAQTNLIRNNSMQGAVAGTPGTLPNNWVASAVTSVVGTGVENGVEYVDLRFTGGSGIALRISPEASVSQAAAANLYTLSSFIKLVSGSVAPFGGLSIRLVDLTPTVDTSVATSFNPDGVLRRYSSSKTTLSGTTTLRPDIISNNVSTGAYDFVLRVGWPQLELWSSSVTTVGGASSPIRTTGTAATRAADTVTAPFTGLVGSNGSISVVYRTPTFTRANGCIVGLRSSTANNDRASLRTASGVPTSVVLETWNGTAVNSGIAVVNGFPGDGSRHAISSAWSPTEQAISLDGGTPNPQNVTTNISPTTLDVGNITGAAQTFGYVERLAVYPTRQNNSQLQQLSQLSNWGG